MLLAARCFLIVALFAACGFAAEPKVELRRVPDGGIEPQVAVDSKGVIHLIYFAGDDKAGDVFHSASSDGGKTFLQGTRVNSVACSAMIAGAVRGPRISLDSKDRAHVIWTGSDIAQPEPRLIGLPLCYTRQAPPPSNQFNIASDICAAMPAFEPQRNIIASGVGVDGGASIAADREGNVDIVWHAAPTPDGDERARKLWVARSSDDFKSCAEIDAPDVGVCACCALHAFYDDPGARHVLFRSADKMVHRDIYLDQRRLSEWKVGKCVMSTAASSGSVVAFEGEGRIGVLDIKSGAQASLGKNNPKHPAVAVTNDFVFIAWTENTAWNKGGSIAWQVLDRGLQPAAGTKNSPGRADDLPVWGTPAAFATPDGNFVVLY